MFLFYEYVCKECYVQYSTVDCSDTAFFDKILHIRIWMQTRQQAVFCFFEQFRVRLASKFAKSTTMSGKNSILVPKKQN
jgi:hypothetical protein